MILTEYEWQAVILSLKVASIAIIFSLPMAVAIAWLLARCHFFGKSLLNNIVHLPLVLPPVVIGYLLLVTMGRNGVIGHWLYETLNMSFSFNYMGAALASGIVAFPLMVRAIRSSIESIDERLEQAASILGAGKWRVFFTITLPLSLPGILVGVILAFVRSMGEFGATITFVSNIPQQTRTIPLAMYTLIETPNAEFAALRLCIIAVIISCIALWLSEWLMNRTVRK